MFFFMAFKSTKVFFRKVNQFLEVFFSTIVKITYLLLGPVLLGRGAHPASGQRLSKDIYI